MTVGINKTCDAVYAASYRVACPLCKRAPRDGCRTRSGVELVKPHDRRIAAAGEAGYWWIGEVKP